MYWEYISLSIFSWKNIISLKKFTALIYVQFIAFCCLIQNMEIQTNSLNFFLKKNCHVILLNFYHKIALILQIFVHKKYVF